MISRINLTFVLANPNISHCLVVKQIKSVKYCKWLNSHKPLQQPNCDRNTIRIVNICWDRISSETTYVKLERALTRTRTLHELSIVVFYIMSCGRNKNTDVTNFDTTKCSYYGIMKLSLQHLAVAVKRSQHVVLLNHACISYWNV